MLYQPCPSFFTFIRLALPRNLTALSTLPPEICPVLPGMLPRGSPPAFLDSLSQSSFLDHPALLDLKCWLPGVLLGPPASSLPLLSLGDLTDAHGEGL